MEKSEVKFGVDRHGWVRAVLKDSDLTPKSQTVEALLLYEILVQLQRIASRPPGIYPSEQAR